MRTLQLQLRRQGEGAHRCAGGAVHAARAAAVDAGAPRPAVTQHSSAACSSVQSTHWLSTRHD